MPVSPARKAAFDVLLGTETSDAYASELLHSTRVAKLSAADHGLATEIAMGVLRWRSVLDEHIAKHIAQPLAKLDAEVLTALRIGAYQLLLLDRIPAHAAINESVELVKHARKRSAAGMVNAVLRKIKPSAAQIDDREAPVSARLEDGPSQRSLQARPAHSPPNSPTLSSRAQGDLSLAKDHPKARACPERPTGGRKSNEDLLWGGAQRVTQNCSSPVTPPNDARGGSRSTRQRNGRTNTRSLDLGNRFANESISAARDDRAFRAHPGWLVERWTRNYGWDAAQEICTYDQYTPNTVLRADAALVEEPMQEGIELAPGRLLSSARVVARGDITRTQAFCERRLTIQDEGSQLVALLLGNGKRVLDCCAAPGGKTRIIAGENPGATVVAMELHPHRAALLRRLVPLPNVQVIAADARRMPVAAHFDRILVDAPCTGTGTFARNPEIKWRLQPEDIMRLQSYQVEILSAAMRQLSPGGQLLYSTCSLEPEENEAIIEHVLRDNASFRILDVRNRLEQLRRESLLAWPDIGSLVNGPYLRTIPGVHPCDGFFAALLERKL
jgi:16S rRNA C967 or C1407 C5-methylase (RsmB/RsmF family)